MRGMRWLVSELDREFHQEEVWCRPTGAILEEYKQEISTGQPLQKISELGGLHRQLLESQEFHSVHSRLFRQIDREEVEREGQGTKDWMEGDLAEVSEKIQTHPVASRWLEEHQEIYSTADAEDALQRTADFGLHYVEDDHSLLDLNSKHVGLGVILPKDQYKMVESGHRGLWQLAAEKREDKKLAVGKEIQGLLSISQIEEFLSTLKEMRQEDIDRINSWNDDWRLIWREVRSQSLRAKGVDEETYRLAMWHEFDKAAGTQEPEYEHLPSLELNWVKEYPYNEKADGGKMINPRKRTGMSKWEFYKALDMTHLHFTKSQWGEVYQKVWDRLRVLILRMAESADTEKAQDRVRRYAGQFNRQLGQKTIGDIAEILSSKE